MSNQECKVFDINQAVLVLDLDYTLAHYRDGMSGLFAVTHALGIQECVAWQALSEAEKENFSFELFYKKLSSLAHVGMKESVFVERLTMWFKENYVLYEDAHAFLFDYLEHLPLVIVTAGNEELQRSKIKLLGLIPHEVVVVPMGEPKLRVLKDISDQYQKTVVFVDDNPVEHAHIAFDGCFGKASYRVRMRRSDSPYEGTVSDLSKFTITSFSQMRCIIPLIKETV